MLQLPKVIGHRGAAAYAPENTLASFREAKRRGASWVEFDVKLAGDGTPILMHDSSLERTLGVDRLVSDTAWPEFAAFDAGRWFGAQFTGERVPSFEQTIGCLIELGLGANIEIKPCAGREVETAEAVVEMLKRPWQALPPLLLSSFKDASLAAAHQAGPEFHRALLIDELGDDWASRAKAVEAMGVNTNGKKLTAVRASQVKQAGYALSVYTINDPAQARALVAMGVDCVITDAPDVILDALTPGSTTGAAI
jgi:glycerophosphoryl diester phosphodiesterase